ncbi:lactose-binding lectin l-2-like [Argopecten irradians]|uniref:lactose-binding lectin l-2-like n=1 Tax=Argopecten irradians TaxID=31199 RepID=UPI00372036F8
MFTSFNDVTRECRLYSILQGPVPTNNTTMWKACVSNNTWPYAHFGQVELGFLQANEVCEEYGGHLAFPHTEEELQQVKQMLYQKEGVKNCCWIGGINNNNTFEWLDGRPMNMSNSTSLWSPENPSGNGECIHLWQSSSFRYDDHYCSMKKQFVCEIDQLSVCD